MTGRTPTSEKCMTAPFFNVAPYLIENLVILNSKLLFLNTGRELVILHKIHYNSHYLRQLAMLSGIILFLQKVEDHKFLHLIQDSRCSHIFSQATKCSMTGAHLLSIFPVSFTVDSHHSVH